MTFKFKILKFKFHINTNKSENQEGDNGNYRLIIGDKKKKRGWLMTLNVILKGDRVNYFLASIKLSPSLLLGQSFFWEFCNLSSAKTFMLYPKRFA